LALKKGGEMDGKEGLTKGRAHVLLIYRHIRRAIEGGNSEFSAENDPFFGGA
jgi:hypothetical protein